MKLKNGRSLLSCIAYLGIGMLGATGSPSTVHAVNLGVDFNLTAKPAAGGMAGAAYTTPREVTAAIFGNPATLTLFDQNETSMGSTFMGLSLDVCQDGMAGVNCSQSATDSLLAPDIGMAMPVSSNLVLGIGIEIDAGLGAEYRTDPISLFGGSGATAVTIPLTAQLMSFNTNFALGYEVNQRWSLGIAATVGYAQAHLGTVGPTQNLALLGFDDFGGTTSPAQDIALSGSLGAVYRSPQGLAVSAVLKLPMKYTFEDAVYYDIGPSSQGFQALPLSVPAEVIVGVASDGGLISNTLVEMDLIWKGYGSAATLEDVWKDQWVLSLGFEHRAPESKWAWRGGAIYMSDLFRTTFPNTLGGLGGLGSIPLGENDVGIGSDFVKLAQVTILPSASKYTLTGGFGYRLSPGLELNLNGQWSFDASLVSNVGSFGTQYTADGQIWQIGIGLSMKLR